MKEKLRAIFCTRSFIAFLLVFLMAAIAGAFFVTALGRRRIQEAQERAENVTEVQANRLSRALDNLFSLTETLQVLVKAGEGELLDLNRLGPDIVRDYSVRNITLAPDGIVTAVYPLKGNEQALGHNLLADPARALEAQLAKDTHKLTLSGPYKLRQGGDGIIGRFPIYLENEGEEDVFWGFACVTIDIPEGLRDADMGKLEKQGYAYELWRTSPDTGEKQMIMRSEAELLGDPVREVIELPNSTWLLDTTPSDGWYQISLILMEVFLVFLFSLLCAFLAKSGLELSESRRSLQFTLAQQTANYRLMDEMNESLRTFRHDIDNHMLSLHYLISNGDLDAARKYMQSVTARLSDTVRIVNTENYVFDALVAEKFYEAENKGVHTEREVIIPGRLSIENEDWSTLFGNVLDNAIEACVKAIETNSELQPTLRLLVHYQNGMLKANIINTAPEPPTESSGFYLTGKTDKANHGIGLKQIRRVVEKYEGVLDTSWKEGSFSLSFMLFHVELENTNR